MALSRREALFGTIAGGLAGCASTMQGGRFVTAAPQTSATFRHGVASGDPQAESVVLWTRITTPDARREGHCEVATDPGFATVVRRLPFVTDGSRDHTVKVVADNLEPGRRYHYRFVTGTEVSAIGRTRTLPERADRVRLAVVSCSNYPFGYFNAYDHIARGDFDAVVHLGDYIYEYGDDGYGAEIGRTLGRAHEPAHEILTLDDYRRRHAQYKSDPGAQAMHGALPVITTWDDHETANNAWERGAENHQPDTEGTWEARRRAALQAYYEWMPVRDPEPGRAREALYRSFSWGGLLTLTSLETRLMARSKQLNYSDIVPTLTSPEAIERFRTGLLADPARQMLGPVQLDHVGGTLAASVQRGEPWRLVANQIIMAEIVAPNLEPYTDEETLAELEQEWDQVRDFVKFTTLGLPLNLDAWDGYPAARERFYARAHAAGARDLLVLTGDTHEAWANDLHDRSGNHMGVELGTTGVTSPAPTQYLKDKAFDYSLLLRRQNRDVRFHDPMHNGYLAVTLDGDEGMAEFVALDTVRAPTYEAAVTAAFDLRKRNGTVELANPRALGLKERVVFRR
jgi:phosphodiesterase/alkaline phosphatase D-like protein